MLSDAKERVQTLEIDQIRLNPNHISSDLMPLNLDFLISKAGI